MITEQFTSYVDRLSNAEILDMYAVERDVEFPNRGAEIEASIDDFQNEEWRAQNIGDRKIVLMTGSYDVAQPMHPRFFQAGKTLIEGEEPLLVVALDSDQYMDSRKPGSRILNYDSRRDIVGAYGHVDFIVRHDGHPIPHIGDSNLINIVRPNIFVMSKATKEESIESRISTIRTVAALNERFTGMNAHVVVLEAKNDYFFENGARVSSSSIRRQCAAAILGMEGSNVTPFIPAIKTKSA